MRCPSCGRDLHPQENYRAWGCRRRCCPNCGAAFPGWIGRFRGRFRRRQRARLGPVCPLSALRPGQVGVIESVQATGARLDQLIAMGLLPGRPVRLVQNFPSYVFRVGLSEFAVDESVASRIRVRLGAAEGGKGSA